MEKDPLQGVCWVEYLAMIAAWVGDKDLAFEQLESIIRQPSPVSYGGLKLLPFWDPLRGDPRFEKLLEEAKQPAWLPLQPRSGVGVIRGLKNFSPTRVTFPQFSCSTSLNGQK